MVVLLSGITLTSTFCIFSSGHFQGVCAIFSHYLLNVKVTDYTTTDITAKAIQELMVTMETEILVPILKRCMNDKQVFEILFLEIMVYFLFNIINYTVF